MKTAKAKERGMKREFYSQTNTFQCEYRYAIARIYQITITHNQSTSEDSFPSLYSCLISLKFLNRLSITLRPVITANQLIFATSPFRLTANHFIFPNEYLQLWSLCNVRSDERIGLSSTIAADFLQRSHSHVRVLRRLMIVCYMLHVNCFLLYCGVSLMR
jgi:hypothetical protein